MYKHDPLEPGERVLFEQTASIPPWTGGQIIVTSTNLRFGPLSTRIPRTMLRLGGKVLVYPLSARLSTSLKA